MFQLTYLLLSQLALAEQPTLSPIKTIGPKSLPPALNWMVRRLYWKSSVDKEKKRKKRLPTIQRLTQRLRRKTVLVAQLAKFESVQIWVPFPLTTLLSMVPQLWSSTSHRVLN